MEVQSEGWPRLEDGTGDAAHSRRGEKPYDEQEGTKGAGPREKGIMVALIDEIRAMAASIGAQLKEKKGVFTLSLVVAERKAFLSRRKLEYVARFRVDEASR